MIESILAGAVAGGLGALVAHLLGNAFRLGDRGRQILTVGLVAAAVAGSRLVLPMLSGPTSPDQAQVAQELSQIPAFKALKELYPNDYAKIERTLTNSLEDRSKSEIDLQNEIRPQIHEVVQRQMRFADDDIAAAYIQLMHGQMELLKERLPEGCVAMGTGAHYDFDPTQVLGKEMVDREQQLMADLLYQTARAPAQPPPAASFSSATDRLVTSVVEALPARDMQLLTPFFQTGAPPQGHEASSAYCRFMTGFLGEIAKLPLADQGMVFRGMAASQ